MAGWTNIMVFNHRRSSGKLSDITRGHRRFATVESWEDSELEHTWTHFFLLEKIFPHMGVILYIMVLVSLFLLCLFFCSFGLW